MGLACMRFVRARFRCLSLLMEAFRHALRRIVGFLPLVRAATNAYSVREASDH
jgi:hypothetical protein